MICPLNTVSLNTHGPHLCAWCGNMLRGRQTRWCSRTCKTTATENHRWTQAKAKAKGLAASFKCAICAEHVTAVHVDHIVPCKGKHGVWGCHHHQTNLRVLCVPCHKDVTRQQHKDGLYKTNGAFK